MVIPGGWVKGMVRCHEWKWDGSTESRRTGFVGHVQMSPAGVGAALAS